MAITKEFEKMKQKIGVAGVGALGSVIVSRLLNGMGGYELIGVSDIGPVAFDVPVLSFGELAEKADIVVECLPAAIVPELARAVFKEEKTLVLLSTSSLLLFPDIIEEARASKGRIIVPSGALSGLDAVAGLRQGGIDSARIASTKPPRGFRGAPHVVQNNIDLDSIKSRSLLFSGNAIEAARAFPANVNVAATLSLAGIGPEKTQVEVWADPDAKGNSHEITVTGGGSTLTSRIENTPDPANPKSSTLAAWSVLACLERRDSFIAIG